MIRYRLDDLGWYQFECLIQSVLKAELGIAVESWGGRGDEGKDAYCEGALRFPDKSTSKKGPFLFQVKFVAEANAVGAKVRDSVIAAVRNEVSRILERIARGRWSAPRHYILITNVPLTAVLRADARKLLAEALPRAQVHTLGGRDVCDLLDSHTDLRRSFPQLLSIRDLDLLLEKAVAKHILEESSSAIECAHDIVPAFVPTSAYERAWEVLRKEHFAVLEGPAEMGKSAIAWMIALAQVSLEWTAVVCEDPSHFFQCYRPNADQVFVADDAFGRTEYDSTRGGRWERQLHHVLPRLDSKHWLIWTSRKHILERAIKEMDLQGEARKFPNPASVLVDASKLSVKEKALILYRHARAGALGLEAKTLVRAECWSIVSDGSFTPERIRRFVKEALPELIGGAQGSTLPAAKMKEAVTEAIRNPTDRMRKSFHALPVAHKWVLLSLLEAGYHPSEASINRLYEVHCPKCDQTPFSEILDELTESFVKRAEERFSQGGWIDWVHPSYRDLVVGEFVNDPQLHDRFLQTMAAEGIKLAVSDSGGAAGNRRLPLMTTPESWHILEERCLVVASSGDGFEIADLLRVMRSAIGRETRVEQKKLLRAIIGAVCDEARTAWNRLESKLSWYELKEYCEASMQVTPLPPLPDLETSWLGALNSAREAMKDIEEGGVREPNVLDDWAELVKVIRSNEPRFLMQHGFPSDYEEDIIRASRAMEKYLTWDFSNPSESDLRTEAETLGSIITTLEELVRIAPLWKKELAELTKQLQERIKALEIRADELKAPEEPESKADPGDRRDFMGALEVVKLFSDL